jgi:hypothetical protein
MKEIDEKQSPFQRAVQDGLVEPSYMVSANRSAENMAKLTGEAVEAALIKTHGNVSAAARILSVTRRALTLRMEKNPALAQLVIDARESMVDDAEGALHKAVQSGEGWAVCFTLKCLGKPRGYIERGDGGESVGGPMNLTINIIRVEVPTAEAPTANEPTTVLPALCAPVEHAERSNGEGD